jgi:hypothetical protein
MRVLLRCKRRGQCGVCEIKLVTLLAFDDVCKTYFVRACKFTIMYRPFRAIKGYIWYHAVKLKNTDIHGTDVHHVVKQEPNPGQTK